MCNLFFGGFSVTLGWRWVVTILRTALGAGCGRGPPPLCLSIDPAAVQSAWTGEFLGSDTIGQASLRVGRFGLRRKLLRVTFPARTRTFGKPRYDMSAIPPDTPRALDPVRLEVEYPPPWWQCLQWLANGRFESFGAVGRGNEFQGLRVFCTPNPNPPRREASAFTGGVDSLAPGGRGESAAGGFPHHRGRGTPDSTGGAPRAMVAAWSMVPRAFATRLRSARQGHLLLGTKLRKPPGGKTTISPQLRNSSSPRCAPGTCVSPLPSPSS